MMRLCGRIAPGAAGVIRTGQPFRSPYLIVRTSARLSREGRPATTRACTRAVSGAAASTFARVVSPAEVGPPAAAAGVTGPPAAGTPESARAATSPPAETALFAAARESRGLLVS